MPSRFHFQRNQLAFVKHAVDHPRHRHIPPLLLRGQVVDGRARFLKRWVAERIANFKQVVKDGDLRLHPLITRLVDKETLEKTGATPVGGEAAK